MNDTISVYVETCQNYQNKQNIFRMRKDSNLREDYSVKEDTDSKYSKRQKTPHNYIIKFQSASQLAIGIQNLKEPQSIMVMDLSNSRIQNLSDQIMCLTSLQILNLSNNLLIEVPNCLYKLQLTSLSINNNLLKSLQISPYWFEKMEKLDVGKNHIRLLPLDLYSLTKLAYLDVRSNDFTDLHHQISKLEPTLQILGLDWVKYSFDKYFKEKGRDLLMDDDLLKFWDVVKAIFKQQKDDDMFSCRDFLQHQQWFNYDLPESISAQLPNQTCIQRPSQFRSSTDLDQSVMTNTAVSLYRNQIEMPASLLHQSVKNEDLGMLRTLIAHDFGMTNIVDEDNHSAFSLAIAEEKYHCAKIFINAQVNPNIGGGSFQSVLSLAVSKMQFYLVRDILNQKIFVHKTDKRGNGPFHYLIPLFKKNIQEATKIGFLLYENGCDPNMRNNSGVTPLHLAIKKSFFSAVKFALQCNEKYGQKVFNFKLLSSKQNSVMHLAAKSENIKIILELFPMFPHLLFTYNCDGQRPFEIIQKNYTLSKLIQNLELVYLQKKIKTIPQQQVIKVERSTTQQLSRQGSWNLEQSEEESIKVALKLTQLQPKFKTNKNTILKAKDQNKIRSDKISSEDVQPIIINKSIQQDRNDIKQIELQNNMSKHRGKNMNKQIHKLLKEIEQSFSEYQANKQESLQQILFYQLKQVEVLKKDPVMNLHLENAQKLQKFNLNDIKINKIKTELDEYEYLQE